MQRLWQRFSNCPISSSFALREGGSDCWALPLLNSPKFIALVAVSGNACEVRMAQSKEKLLFKVSSLC